MLMRKFAATSAMLIAALGVAAGTTAGSASAAPIATPAPAPAGVQITVIKDKNSATFKTTSGSMAVENGKFEIKNDQGTVMTGAPLVAQIGDFLLPIKADVSGRTATLTPVMDPAKAVYKPVALPFENTAPWKTPYDREQAAWNRMKDTISTGVTVAALISATIGAVVGCGVGAVTGLAVTGVLLALFGAGPIGGCLVGGAALAAAFGIVGTVLVAVPIAIGAAIQYFATINAPFTPAH